MKQRCVEREWCTENHRNIIINILPRNPLAKVDYNYAIFLGIYSMIKYNENQMSS